jgi:hypothetical protein
MPISYFDAMTRTGGGGDWSSVVRLPLSLLALIGAPLTAGNDGG